MNRQDWLLLRDTLFLIGGAVAGWLALTWIARLPWWTS